MIRKFKTIHKWPKTDSLLRLGLLAVLFAFLLMTSGCSDSATNPPSSPKNYSGELRWDKTPGFVGGNDIDTVRITISGTGFTYTLLTNKGAFCDASGEVNGFGGDSADFMVGSISGMPCDSVRILRGKFSAVFRGDSLLMSGELRDGIRQMDYDFRLVLLRPI